MCLTTKDPTIKVAKKNMIVYKGGSYGDNSFAAGFRNYIYKKMESNPIVPLVAVPETRYTDTYRREPTGFHTINRGYHSYNRFHHGLFIIPKGTEYIDGWFNDCKGIKNRVSSNIVYIGCAWNPFTWIKALSFKSSNK